MDMAFYFQAVDKMQAAAVDADYIQGWVGGYMGNPKREEQRVTEAYEAGYADGARRDPNAFDAWTPA